MMKLYLLLAFLFLNYFSYSQQNPTWITKIEDPYAQMIAIENLSANQLIAVKTKDYSKLNHVITINKKTGDTTEILKLNGGAGFKVTAMKVDYLGNVIITGTYKKEMRIDAYEKKSSTPVIKTFLAKFKPGQALDTTKIQHFEALETSELGILPNNEIVLSGFFRYKAEILGQHLEAGLDDVFVMKLTPNLQLGWIKNYGLGPDERTTGMHISKDGNIIVAAKFGFKFELGENRNIELNDGSKNGAAVWKMSPSGNVIWHHIISGFNNGKVEVTTITSDNDHIFLGTYLMKECLMNGDTLSSMGRQDLLIVRLDQNGKNRQLIMHIKSPYDLEIAGLKSENQELFLGGHFQKRIHIKDDLVYAKGDTTGYSADKEIFYVIFNKQSNTYQLQTIGSADSESCQTIAVDESNFYLAGTYDKSFDWGEFSLNNEDAKPDAYITALPRNNDLSSNNNVSDEGDENEEVDGIEDEDQIEPIEDSEPPISVDEPVEQDEINISDEDPEEEDEDEADVDSSAENPEEQDEAEVNNNNDCYPPPANITKVIPENYAFTAYWDAIPNIQHYTLYVSNHKDFSDTIYISKPLYSLTEPSHRVSHLKGKHQYFFNIVTQKRCDGSDVISRSLTTPVKTTCIDDTIIMKHNDGHVQFQIVDCEGNVKCMGRYFNDTSIVIGECNDELEGKLLLPENKEPILVGPIDPTKKDKCKEGQWPVPITEGGKATRIECVKIPQPYGINHSCYKYPTDQERIICLANEGVEKVGKYMDRMTELREEVLSMKIDESLSEEEKNKLKKQAEYKMKRFEALKDTLDIIRADYEERLNAIVIKGNIIIDVKNEGAGMTIDPKAVATSVRWHKYDDAFKFPGPQLLIDVKMSNFPRKHVKGPLNKNMINTIDDVQMKIIGEDGELISGIGTLGTSHCIQVKGVLRTNIAIHKMYENLSHVSFLNPYYKNIDPKWYGKCSPESLASKNADKQFFNSTLTGIMNGNNIEAISNIEFHMLLSFTTKIRNNSYSEAFNAYYFAMNKISDVFFEFYSDKKMAHHILEGIRSHVGESYNDAFYHNGFTIYYGFKKVDEATEMKIKKLLE